MHKKKLTKTSKLLLHLVVAGNALSIFFPTPKEFRRRAMSGDWKNYKSLKSTLYQLHKRGWLRFVDKNNQKFIQLTKKGQIKALFTKATLPQPTAWDGKWRVCIFDIPEESRNKRSELRTLLSQSGFKKLQDSVYINPHALSREAVKYLELTGLVDYVRLMKVEYMGDDSRIRKLFKL